MTPEQNAAYVIAQANCAMIEAMGMAAENAQRAHRGESMAFTHDSFKALIEHYGIHHNAVCTVMQE